jgi:outer membrane lipoprotein-sorting protein
MRRRILALVPLALLLTGCPVRVDFGPHGRLEDPAFVVRTIRHRQSLVHSLVGEGRLSVDAPEGSGTLRVAVEVARPDRLYFETADLFGTPRGTFASDGERFSFYRPDLHLFVEGPATADALSRHLPVDLTPEELAGLLLASFPILDGEMRMEVDPDASAYVIVIAAPGGRQRLTVGTRDLRLISVETRGERPFDAFFEAFDDGLLRTHVFPKGIRLVLPERRTELRLRYGDLALNREPAPGTFRLAPPPGARIEREDPP